MWLVPSSWPDITASFSGEGQQDFLVESGTDGEVRLETG